MSASQDKQRAMIRRQQTLSLGYRYLSMARTGGPSRRATLPVEPSVAPSVATLQETPPDSGSAKRPERTHASDPASTQIVKRLSALHAQYGDVIRIGPDQISFANEEAWQDIYTRRPGQKDIIKDKHWYIAPNGMPQNLITTSDPDVHTRMRKLLSTCFSEKSLRSQYPTIEAYADLLVNRLRHLVHAAADPASGAVVDIVDWINFFTVDIIGDLALGESFDCMKSNDYHPWVKTLDTFLQGMAYAAATRYYPSIEWLVTKLLPKKVMDMQRRHTEFIHERISRRLSLKTDRPDFLTPFMQDNANYETMSIGEIESTFAILIVAGSETTATTLAGITSYLMQAENKHVLTELVAEIRGAFQREEDITIEGTRPLTYLEAVINEGLRLCNPIPGGLPRVVPKGGGTYAGHFLPEKTYLSIRPYNVNRSNALFHKANIFVPERWYPLSKRPAEYASDHLTASNAFSVGPASCLGRGLAWAEMRLFLARLLWAFELEAEQGKAVDWNSQKMLMIVQKSPQELRIKVREDMDGKDSQVPSFLHPTFSSIPTPQLRDFHSHHRIRAMDTRTLQQRAETLLENVLEGCQKSTQDSHTLAIYDSAWVSMISKNTDGHVNWLFPESFDFVVRNQEADGSWRSSDSVEEGLLNTLAALLALKKHAKPICSTALETTHNLEAPIFKATTFLQGVLQHWDVEASTGVAFELLVPAHFSMLQDEGIAFDFPQKPVLMALHAKKLAKFDPTLLYGPHKTTMLHSLEGFVGRVNFDKIEHHLTRGSQMGSPSSTAAYLMNCSIWDVRAENYLREVITKGGGHGNGGVPSVYPSNIFELTWV
ncbi:MAG: hypothetical protein Q9218_006271 [Villophora microphyllina]